VTKNWKRFSPLLKESKLFDSCDTWGSSLSGKVTRRDFEIASLIRAVILVSIVRRKWNWSMKTKREGKRSSSRRNQFITFITNIIINYREINKDKNHVLYRASPVLRSLHRCACIYRFINLYYLEQTLITSSFPEKRSIPPAYHSWLLGIPPTTYIDILSVTWSRKLTVYVAFRTRHVFFYFNESSAIEWNSTGPKTPHKLSISGFNPHHWKTWECLVHVYMSLDAADTLSAACERWYDFKIDMA